MRRTMGVPSLAVLLFGALLAACGGSSAPPSNASTLSTASTASVSTAAKPSTAASTATKPSTAASNAASSVAATGSASAKPASSTVVNPTAQPTLVRWGETVTSPTMVTASLSYLLAHPEVAAKHGVKFEFHAFAQGGPMYDAFRGGSLDMMDSGADSIASFAEQGIPIVGLKPWTKIPSDWVIAVKKDSPYQKLTDLKGKTFVTLTTSGTSFFTPYLLFKKNGLDLKNGDLKVVALPAPAIYSSILDGKADAGMLQNPNTDKAIASGQFRIIAHISDDLAAAYNTPYFHLAVASTKKFEDASPKAAQGAIDTFIDVMKNVSLQDLAQATAANKDLSFGSAAAIQKELDEAKGNLVLDMSTTEMKSDLDKYYQILNQVGAISKPVNVSTLYRLS